MPRTLKTEKDDGPVNDPRAGYLESVVSLEEIEVESKLLPGRPSEQIKLVHYELLKIALNVNKSYQIKPRDQIAASKVLLDRLAGTPSVYKPPRALKPEVIDELEKMGSVRQEALEGIAALIQELPEDEALDLRQMVEQRLVDR